MQLAPTIDGTPLIIFFIFWNKSIRIQTLRCLRCSFVFIIVKLGKSNIRTVYKNILTLGVTSQTYNAVHCLNPQKNKTTKQAM